MDDKLGSLDLIEEMVMDEEEDMTGKWVWTAHPEKLWIQAQIIAVVHDEEHPSQVNHYLIDSPEHPGSFKKVNVHDVHRVDPTHLQDLSNVCHMNDMHEAPLLDLLRRRFFDSKIYTYTGDILVALNPYESISGLYDWPLQHFALANSAVQSAVIESGQASGPHIYQIGNRALCALSRAKVHSTAAEGNDSFVDHCNQSVIISGESGAGKTEASKHVVNFLIAANKYLTTVHQDNARAAQESNVAGLDLFGDDLQDMLVQSSVILESFGNAKTVRNDNSSRFGKYIKLMYLPHRQSGHGQSYPKLAAAQTETFLLEKSRLTSIGEGERCYHIFYQMLSGLADEELRNNLRLHHLVDDFQLLMQGGFGILDGDQEEFQRVHHALRMLSCTDEELELIFTVLAALLHLSNFVHDHGNEQDAEDMEGHPVHLQFSTIDIDALAGLLGVEPMIFKTSLTMQQLVIARRSSIKVKILTAAEVANNVAALLKWIYGNLFEWIVRKINVCHGAYLQDQDAKQLSFIGILDIFGFEILGMNSFEQLCINFTNERLQQQFNQYVFVKEQEMYCQEGLTWNNISFRDNQPIIDIIASPKKPQMGLLLLMEELGMLNRKPDDMALISLFNQVHDSSDPKSKTDVRLYSKSRLDKSCFSLKHFAGEVVYHIDGFLAKNNDSLQSDLMKLMMTTSNPFLRNVMKFDDCQEGQPGYIPPMFSAATDMPSPSNASADSTPPPPATSGFAALTNRFRSQPPPPPPATTSSVAQSSTGGKKMASASSVSTQFRSQLDSLMNTLSKTTPNYVKCVKSNALKRSQMFGAQLVNEQLRYSGVMEVVRIRREGFPLRMSFTDFYREYDVLAKGKSKDLFPDSATCSVTDARRCSIELATSCLRPDQFKIGHSLIFLRDKGKTIMIDAIRQFFHRKVAKIQGLARMLKLRKTYVFLIQMIRRLQALCRCRIQRRLFLKTVRAGVFVQSVLIMNLRRQQFRAIYAVILEKRRIRKIILIQKLFRGNRGRCEFRIQFADRLRMRNQAATLMQRIYRGYSCRLMIWNSRFHIAATMIQAQVRARCARIEVARLLRAIVCMQSFARMAVARIGFAHRLMVAVSIQAAIRRFLAYRRFQLMKRAAVRIQCFYRQASAFRFVFMRIAATWMIQSLVRRFIHRNRFLVSKRAAVVIQKYIRRHLALQCVMVQYFALVNVQRFLRGCYYRLQVGKQLRALVLLQSVFRMHICQSEFLRLKTAVIALQCHFRGRLCRQHTHAHAQTVLTLQCAVRQLLARRRVLRRKKAIVKIQSAIRMSLLKVAYFFQLRGLVLIQSQWRRYSARKTYLLQRCGVIYLQSLYRRRIAITFLRRSLAACVCVQSMWRMTRNRQQYQIAKLSIIAIQSQWRALTAQARYMKTRALIVRLQSWVRMLRQRSILRMTLAATIFIQSCFRRGKARHHFLLNKFAAIFIQSHWRRYLQQSSYASDLCCIIKAQTEARRWLQRRQFLTMKIAQIVIATAFRRHHDLCKFQYQLSQIVRIQHCIRRFLSMLENDGRMRDLFPVYCGDHKPTSRADFSTEKLMQRLSSHPEDRFIRLVNLDLCTLLQSLLIASQGDAVEAASFQIAELFDVDRYARNSAHYLAMYPSAHCALVLGKRLDTFQEAKSETVMLTLDDDDDDNEIDSEENDNLRQLKQALHTSVGTSTLKQGWLKKKRGGWSWQRRWFVLTEDYLIYSKTPQTISNPKFAIPIRGCSIQRLLGSKDPVIELTSTNIMEKKTFFGGTKTSKSILFLADNEKELQEWLTPLRAMSGVTILRESPAVHYVNTELRKMWAGAVDKHLETPVHLLVRMHCFRLKKIGKSHARQSLISKIRNSKLKSAGVEMESNSVVNSNGIPLRHVDTDCDYSLRETIEVLSWLVEYGCPINGQNVKGETALHLALQLNADPLLVRSLLLKGADGTGFRDDSGNTAESMLNAQSELSEKYSDVMRAHADKHRSVSTNLRNFVSSSKIKGFSYCSLMFGLQTLVTSKAILGETAVLSVSAFNSSKHLMESVVEICHPLWMNMDSEASQLFWGSTWHMQTPLNNLEPGSFLLLEFKCSGTNQSAPLTLTGIVDLNVESIDSGPILLEMTSHAENGRQLNPVLATNDTSSLVVEVVLNEKNGLIDVKSVYGM